MNDDRRMLEALDACRPGSTDVLLPEMAGLASRLETDPRLARVLARVQRLDASIVAAMHDVPLPNGLLDRILTRVTDEQPSTLNPQPSTLMRPPTPTRSRRWWLAASSAAAVLAAITLGVLWSVRDPVTCDAIPELAQDWYQKVRTDAWRALPTAPKVFPVSRFLAAKPLGWQPVAIRRLSPAVAYNVTRRGGPVATLIVLALPKTVGPIPSRPPQQPHWTSDLNRATAAWREGKLLYVLVVEGPEKGYRDYVLSQSPPLA